MQNDCNKPTQFGPSAQLLRDAREVVNNPARYAAQPLVRRLAWATLMAGQGRAMRQGVVAKMPVQIGAPTAGEST